MVTHVDMICGAFRILFVEGRLIQAEIIIQHQLKSVKLNAHTGANAIIK
jgi:hypothetical protein